MIHKECRGIIFVDVTSSYKMLANVTQDKGGGGLSTIEIHVYNTKDTCSGLTFWCVKCDEKVSLSNVEFKCRGCGELMSVEDGTVPLETGGIWCEGCAQGRCAEEESVSLQSIYDNDCVKLT